MMVRVVYVLALSNRDQDSIGIQKPPGRFYIVKGVKRVCLSVWNRKISNLWVYCLREKGNAAAKQIYELPTGPKRRGIVL